MVVYMWFICEQCEGNFILNYWELIWFYTSIAVACTSINVFEYCYQILIILFSNDNLFAHKCFKVLLRLILLFA